MGTAAKRATKLGAEEAPQPASSPGRRRGTVQNEVLQRLRHALMVGMLIPGQVISIRKLAALFGTSAMPVRDALSQLVAANALEEMPNRSLCVPILSRDRIRDLFEARAALETLAASRACTRDGKRLADIMTPINDEIVETIDTKRDFYHALELNNAFHFALYAGAGSNVLMPLIESLWLQCGPTLFATLATPNVFVSRSQHQRIIDGLREGDAQGVSDALAQEISATCETLLRGVDHRDDASAISPLSRLPLTLRS
jgi:DNA-binding GntR family transcriptional regulator